MFRTSLFAVALAGLTPGISMAGGIYSCESWRGSDKPVTCEIDSSAPEGDPRRFCETKLNDNLASLCLVTTVDLDFFVMDVLGCLFRNPASDSSTLVKDVQAYFIPDTAGGATKAFPPGALAGGFSQIMQPNQGNVFGTYQEDPESWFASCKGPIR